ncbi:calsenilin-like isoform X3 [Paramacrobiotus metropolitanus]|uniref:calsenilin-like isoform X3 n=1 Tax=Paramacrobiotus metropolitanus TaxID=2943436 RepID=UPI002445C6EA|nr:calsenilin-like isoform X3 [Paramacrobiotus metropolitanus]
MQANRRNNTAQKTEHSLMYAVIGGLRRLFLGSGSNRRDPDLEDLDLHVSRYMPTSLDALTKSTKFSRKELQFIYRSFKQDCPTGIVTAEKFKELYAQFFPLGDATLFAKQVFQCMDHDMDGNVNFEEFVVMMSVLSRGSLDEKLQWIFNLYDVNGDGQVTLEAMLTIGTSIYDLLGKHSEPPIYENSVKDHISKIFTKMDLNQDGIVTFDEFKNVCINDEKIRRNLTVFDTFL